MLNQQEHEQDAQPDGGNSKEVDRHDLTEMIAKERFQVCDDAGRRTPLRIRETVRSETIRPSILSSPWILGARQSGLAIAICRIN